MNEQQQVLTPILELEDDEAAVTLLSNNESTVQEVSVKHIFNTKHIFMKEA